MTRYYEVAGQRFCVSGAAEYFGLMENYEPFGCAEGETVFSLNIDRGEAPVYTEELRQMDDHLQIGASELSTTEKHAPKAEQEIVCGHTASGEAVYGFLAQGETAGWLVCSADHHEGRLITTGLHTKMAIDNALMIIYAMATADKATVLFHAAAVSFEDKGYLFLGPSGTGKSTHARLWLRYVAGTSLMNDDNPVVGIGQDGTARVFGSPWSGKTPCYRNVKCPLGAIVVLSQAPANRIHRLSGIHAYAKLAESISGKRWDARIADGLHQTQNLLASAIPVWHLECLPDEEAARLCNETITR